MNFIPGSTELGILQDMDRPLLSKMKHKKMLEGNRDDDHMYPTYVDREIQTEGTLANSRDIQVQVPEARVIKQN